MAAHTSLLLVITLCAAKADSLICRSCKSQFDNAQCQAAEICSKAGNYTTTYTKACASFCSPITGFSTSVSCCSTDLCNVSGGASIKASSAAIILALGSLLTILRSSVL
ncbi:uncharacterized protein LOC143781689 isoform X2 [Ranitomeya variabilis]|uniref:uncharacterized protein LOC143781689 isoform X2 n=1 Tax=Ranitomeya variabilis TaxID=490064 RepID=UPI004055E209